MQNDLLTMVVTQLVNKKDNAKEYGVSILNIPTFNYASFANNICPSRDVEIFFLGFDSDEMLDLKKDLPTKDRYKYSFSIEAAELSRNSGDESKFRIIIIKRTEIEKLSSLRWFPEITIDMVYYESCDIALNKLNKTNVVIESLIKALKRKSIRNILGFERVLTYLDGLVSSPIDNLPETIKSTYYKLGLLQDNTLDQGNPSIEEIVSKIKKNHGIVERIGNLEQAERQCITNYYASENRKKHIPRIILQYYSKKNIELLGKMELSQVEECLKTAKKKKSGKRNTKPNKSETIKATSLASQLIFDDNIQQIHDVIEQLTSEIDERPNQGKRENININIDDVKLQIKTEPITEKIASELIDEDEFGGIIYADVNSPYEAITDIDKYSFVPLKSGDLKNCFEKLEKISSLLSDGEGISEALSQYLLARKAISPYKIRLQDAPMFPILVNMDIFKNYLKSYEILLLAVNTDYPKILAANASSTIKKL